MKSVIHRAEDRGFADHGWLNAYHSFSFANYYDPDKVQFGALRVLNDDSINGGQGFGMHPHDNMEIITIPISGAIEHKDSMGNQGIIREGEIQVMSAGTGIYHSEFNHNKDEKLKVFQIWVIPKLRDVKPRYGQFRIEDVSRPNEFYLIVSPEQENSGAWIHQDAWFSLCELEKGNEASYELNKKDHGIYLFIIEGSVMSNDIELNNRDAIGIWQSNGVSLTASENSRLLLMEVPMIN
jgi:redox-sensitive bicupin YhaK (pirin superfamily)